MRLRNLWFAGVLLAALLPAACSDQPEPVALAQQAPRADVARFAPTPLGPTITVGGTDLTIYPYTADSLPATPVDPINLVFVGPYADPRAIRAELLGLGGDRSAFGLPGPNPYLPGVFECHWADGIGGGNQISYVDGMGWMGSVIQLTCGPYNVFRFHIRLFPFGNVTLAGAHFEMNIPGTADHEPLSWELARAVVATDLVASGRAVPLGNVTTGSQPGTFRSVRPEIYNAVGPMGDMLRGMLAQLGNSGPNILNSGQATVLQLNEPPAVTPGSNTVTLPLTYNVTMPQPFCKDGEFLEVKGPVELSQTTTVTASGDYSAIFEARALVDVKPLVFGGETFQARIHQVEASSFSDQVAQVTTRLSQRMIPPAAGRGFQVKWLRVGPADAANYQNQVHCYGE